MWKKDATRHIYVMRDFEMRLGWLFSILILAGCSNLLSEKCGNKFLLLGSDGSGGYAFRAVTLPTLKDPTRVKGPAAHVYYESAFNSTGFTGPVAQPNLTRAGDVCVPTDVASASALSVYSLFERLKVFDDALGVGAALIWPRQVGLQVYMVGAPARITHNNAHYMSRPDAIAVVPYQQAGLPLEFNEGVMAHEHFHAHFQVQVTARLNANMSSWEPIFYPNFQKSFSVEILDRVSVNTVRGINNFILRAWNEGLADVYGAIFSRRPDFLVASSPEGLGRRLDLGLVRRLALGSEFVERAQSLATVSGDSVRAFTAEAYGEGALLARIIYQLAHTQDVSPEALLRRIMAQLPKLHLALVNDYEQRIFDVEEVLPLLLPDLTINSEACEILRQVVSDQLMKRRYGQCGG